MFLPTELDGQTLQSSEGETSLKNVKIDAN